MSHDRARRTLRGPVTARGHGAGKGTGPAVDRPEKIARGRAVVEALRQGGEQPIPSARAAERLLRDLAEAALAPGNLEKATTHGTVFGERVYPTQHQIDLLQDMTDGLELSAIAAKHKITFSAVRRGLERLYWNLGVEGQSARITAAAMCVSAGLISARPLPEYDRIAHKPALGARRRSAATSHILSPTELKELRLCATGHTSKEIAALSGVTFETVKARRSTILHRLGAKSIAHGIHLAHERGILP